MTGGGGRRWWSRTVTTDALMANLGDETRRANFEDLVMIESNCAVCAFEDALIFEGRP
jgi:hypothetical protein